MNRRPIAAVLSQLIVAASSLLLSLVALRELGTAGLGVFSLLLGVLITVNAVQTGWIGDSLTVLDRFDPGIRRALFQSQWIAIGMIAVITFTIALQIDGIDGSTALLFATASVAWSVEETFRRVLIARREFWGLVANDSTFAVGSFGMLAVVVASGSEITIDTMIVSLLAGAVVAIGAAVIQLPRIELLRGPFARARMQELASFASWRAIQVGLRPGTLAVMRAVVASTASLTALGELETARLLVAPVLTVVNGAGVYLLPTYADQVKRRLAFRPAVGRAMVIVACLAAAYGLFAVWFRDLLLDVLTDGSTSITTGAIISWVTFSLAFGLGIPAGSAMVALGHSRRTFTIRAVDAVVGITAAAVFAMAGWVSAVPAGLAVGAFVGAALLLRAVRGETRTDLREPSIGSERAIAEIADPDEESPAVFEPVHWRWTTSVSPSTSVPPPPLRPVARTRPVRPVRARHPAPRRSTAIDWKRELLWMVPLVLIVATEFKIRRRSIDDALSGSIDLMIAIELIVYAVVGVWALWRLVPSRPRLEPLTIIMWGYVLSTAVSALYSQYPTLALARAVQLVVIATVIQLLAGEGGLQAIRRFLHGWVAVLSVSIVVGLLYVAPTTRPQQGRFTWLSVHSVSAGSMLALSVPVLFGLWIAAGRRALPWPRWIYGSLFAVHLLFLLLTRTRGSIGGALAAIAVIAWLSSGRKVRPELVLGSLVVAGAMALAFGRQALEFLTRGESVDQIGTFNRRTEIWSLAWDSFLQRPVFGLGFNSAKGVFFDETGLGGAHNAAINVMIDVGLVGLAWWFALIIGAIVVLRRLQAAEKRSPVLLLGATGTARSDHLIVVGVFTAMLVNSVTTEGLGAGVNVSAIWLFVVCAWLTILDRDQRAVRSARQRELTGKVRDRQLEALS